jgi:hypothetical protein
MDEPTTSRRVNFTRVNDAALARFSTVLAAFLPGGRREGREWVAKNPTRPDKAAGSFKVNIATAKWADFSTGDRGGDPVSLVAYVCALPQREAAIRLAEALGCTPYE